ncbi:protein BIG GRAIN 1-like E [Iris pallida]|uniref:Protein BIG GRAIN 1-like E n=1 Tax=Iris pallida TaxID=29817 RepID=A0AAX6HM00_IRIPA|nr:protein BIG GRAIN 1-like E [Iris pallida]
MRPAGSRTPGKERRSDEIIRYVEEEGIASSPALLVGTGYLLYSLFQQSATSKKITRRREEVTEVIKVQVEEENRGRIILCTFIFIK